MPRHIPPPIPYACLGIPLPPATSSYVQLRRATSGGGHGGCIPPPCYVQLRPATSSYVQGGVCMHMHRHAWGDPQAYAYACIGGSLGISLGMHRGCLGLCLGMPRSIAINIIVSMGASCPWQLGCCLHPTSRGSEHRTSVRASTIVLACSAIRLSSFLRQSEHHVREIRLSSFLQFASARSCGAIRLSSFLQFASARFACVCACTCRAHACQCR